MQVGIWVLFCSYPFIEQVGEFYILNLKSLLGGDSPYLKISFLNLCSTWIWGCWVCNTLTCPLFFDKLWSARSQFQSVWMEALLSSRVISHGSLVGLGIASDGLGWSSKEYPLKKGVRRDIVSAVKFNSRTVISAVHRIHGSKLIEGVDEEMNTLAQENMDYAPARRQVREAFTPIQQNLDHCLFKARFLGILNSQFVVRP